jgi:hypothetical protein
MDSSAPLTFLAMSLGLLSFWGATEEMKHYWWSLVLNWAPCSFSSSLQGMPAYLRYQESH